MWALRGCYDPYAQMDPRAGARRSRGPSVGGRSAIPDEREHEEDEAMKIRKSHENPAVMKLYEEFLGEPLSHKSHELLHTHYTPRERRVIKAADQPRKVKVEG